MSPEPALAQNKTVIYLLGVIVVLLVAVIAIFWVTANNNKATTTAGSSTSAPAASTTATPTTQPGMGSSTATTFDPATATKVPSGTTTEAYVKKYYQSILDKQWDTAFKMQPAASQQGQSVADFQQTQEQMYGMTAFKVINSATQGDTATVEVEQTLGKNGTWGALWTFVKYNGAWVVKSRQVSMK